MPADTWPSLNNYSLQGRTAFRPPDIDRRLGTLIEDPRWTHASAGLFLTPTVFSDPREAKRHLSLTYDPSAIHSWSPPLSQWIRGADRFHLEDAYGNANQFNRVWPAFGQRGGALETVLTQGTLPEPEFHGIDGGQTDRWVLDTPLTRIPPADVAATIGELQGVLRGRDYPSLREDETVGSVKIVPDVGIAINEGGRDGLGHQWTVSIAFNETDSGLSLKFWGALWEDSDRTRRILLMEDAYRRIRDPEMTKQKAFGTAEGRRRFREKSRDALDDLDETKATLLSLVDNPTEEEFNLPAPFFHNYVAPI